MSRWCGKGYGRADGRGAGKPLMQNGLRRTDAQTDEPLDNGLGRRSVEKGPLRSG